MNFEHLNFIILFGKTGCGKSDILRHLKTLGEQILDLEKLAKHKGSAFGWLQGQSQPDQEAFDKMLDFELSSFHSDKPVWVEFESNYLGNIRIPESLFNQFQKSKMIVIEVERKDRIEKIVDDYQEIERDELLASTQKIKKKVSPKKYRFIRKKIKDDEYHLAVSAIISYYDRIYENALAEKSEQVLGLLRMNSKNTAKKAETILSFYKSLKKQKPDVVTGIS